LRLVSVFAAALAYSPCTPERGWRRTGEAELAATGVAGTDRQLRMKKIH